MVRADRRAGEVAAKIFLGLLLVVIVLGAIQLIGNSENNTFSRVGSAVNASGGGFVPVGNPFQGCGGGKPGRGFPPPSPRYEPPVNTETYNPITSNPLQSSRQDPLSTFSIDVDTASYSIVRRFLLDDRQLPPRDAVRIEELVNYFDYDYPQPEGDHPVRVVPEVSACPWNRDHRLVRIAVQGKRIDTENVPPRNLVFLIDVSGSMDAPNRLPLVKQGLELLVEQLTEKDRVAMVVYAGQAGLVLPSTAGDQKAKIRAAIARLQAGGSTNGGDGIALAYRIAQENFVKGGVNRVILATDGDFNVGVTSTGDLIRLVEQQGKRGVFLTALGFGMGNLKDATLQKLSMHGHGHYAYIDSPAEARKVFVEDGMALVTLAKDVKIQVEFNPRQVEAYRLIGYEKRILAAQDFNDDQKDAGVMGAGHRVTALYEVVPSGRKTNVPAIDALKYQETPLKLTEKETDELMTVKLRYKDPEAETSRLLSVTVKDNDQPLAKASEDFRFAVAVAGFALVLRGEPTGDRLTLVQVHDMAQGAVGVDVRGHRAEFLRLVKAAERLKERE